MDDGHKAYISPAVPGMRAMAIVVNSDFLQYVVEDSFLISGRACSLRFAWGGWSLVLVCAHLSPKNSFVLYSQSLTDMKELIDAHPNDYVVLAVDAQDGVGCVDENVDLAAIIGPHGDGNQGWKGVEFSSVMHEYGLPVLNTLHYDELGPHTCHFYLRAEATQIDFMSCNLPQSSIVKCGKFECDATPTDHWPLRLSIASRRTQKKRDAGGVKREPKPVGWVMHDPTFHSQVMAKILVANSQKKDPHTEMNNNFANKDCICCFTDGAFFSKRRLRTAGWGFVVFKAGLAIEAIHAGIEPELTAFGSVQLSADDRLFLGAKQLSNNTAELSAIIELSFYIFASLQAQDPARFEFTIYSDSSYVVGLVNGKFSPKENLHISLLAVHMVQQLRRLTRVNVCWIKAHAGLWGNELADRAAKAGATPSNHPEFWSRSIVFHSWGEQDFVSLLQVALGSVENTGGGSLVASRFVGADDVVRETPAGIIVPSLGTVTKAISEVAKSCGKRQQKTLARLPDDDPTVNALRELERLRRQEHCGVIRHWYSSQIAKARRKVRRKVMALRCMQAAEAGRSFRCLHSRRSKRKHVLSYLDADNNLCREADPTGKGDLLFSFYSDLFTSPDLALPEWIDARWNANVLQELPIMSGTLVRMAALSFKKGKCCAEDCVVFEMLHALDQEFFDLLAYVFRFRLLNHYSEHSDAIWEKNVITLLEKRVGASFIKDFRPITVLPVLYRLYSKVLELMCGERLQRTTAPQFAFKPRHRVEEVMFIWRSLIEKSIEWNIHLFGLDGDVYKAYDSTSHALVISSLRSKGVHDVLIAAWLREIRHSASSIKLDAGTMSKGVRRTRSIFQGDPAAPSIFNACLDHIAGRFHVMCQRKQWGVELSHGYYLGIVCFADNYWLFATSANMLESMANEWLTLLDDAGFHTPVDDLTWCTTAPDDFHASISVKGHEAQRTSRKVGFKVLGTLQTFDNTCNVEIKHRVDKAWKAFHLHRDILCSKSASMGKRLRCLQALVASTLLWGASSWNVTKRQRSLLRGTQQRMISKMLGIRRSSLELLEDYCSRVKRCISGLLQTHHLQRWDEQQMRVYYDFMGFLARMRQRDAQRLTYQVLRYKDLNYIAALQAEFGHQTHCRRLHVWRLEWPLFKYDHNWQCKAQSMSEWNASWPSWCASRQ